jgi:hypothetical protein
VLRSQHRVDGRGEVARTQDVWGAEGISGRVKFLLLAWAGMPKSVRSPCLAAKENDENESDSNTHGGQLGHPGKTLDFFENPDHVIDKA